MRCLRFHFAQGLLHVTEIEMSADFGKVTLKSNGDEALSNDSL